MAVYLIMKDGVSETLIGNPTKYIHVELPVDFREDFLRCYEINNGVASLNIDKMKTTLKERCRIVREDIFNQLDVLYFIESEKIYKKEKFSRTPELDEIIRKKEVLRDIPQQIDALTTIQQVSDFVIISNIDNL